MQIEIHYSHQQPIVKNTITYEQAKQMQEIKKLEDELEKKKESYRYLYGKRKGSWGRMTMADEKRSLHIDKLTSKINYLKTKLCNFTN